MVRDLVLQAPGRLVTLTGTGGCGKTQLALLAAAGLSKQFAEGVWLVKLAPVRAAHLVPDAVAAVLGRHERSGQALLDTLLAYLEDRELLLVLDNCEHLIDACARLAERVLSSGPRVRLLATSREPLRIQGEITWRVPSLALPDQRRAMSVEELARSPAVQLFVARTGGAAGLCADRPERANCRAGLSTARWPATGDRAGSGAAASPRR